MKGCQCNFCGKPFLDFMICSVTIKFILWRSKTSCFQIYLRVNNSYLAWNVLQTLYHYFANETYLIHLYLARLQNEILGNYMYICITCIKQNQGSRIPLVLEQKPQYSYLNTPLPGVRNPEQNVSIHKYHAVCVSK